MRKARIMKPGTAQEKVLLLLLSGIALSCSSSPKQSFRILSLASKEWRKINHSNLTRTVRSLYSHQLIFEKKHSDGSVSLHLTTEGRRRATLGQLLGIKIKNPKHWDSLWRLVLFDIPEKHRKFRDIFRSHLKAVGFHELQHSVFIFPFPCEKEITSLVKLYQAEPFVRIITAEYINNEAVLKKLFKLK